MIDPKYLLSDEQMRDYIANGYLVLDTSLPAALHEEIYRRTSEVLEKEGNPGNNILPRVPQLRQVFDDPALRGALTSVLGPDYIMHSHRHCHVNRGGSDGGGTHKDSYWGFNRLPRNHRTRWAMLFYYPQDVTIANGPTGVVPGSQNYLAKESWETAGEAEPCLGAAGTAVLVHFDLWHRAFPNHTDEHPLHDEVPVHPHVRARRPHLALREAGLAGRQRPREPPRRHVAVGLELAPRRALRGPSRRGRRRGHRPPAGR